MGILDVFDSIGNIGANIANTALQGANLDYQKNLQKQIFQREDTAIQRRVTDLKAAGLSPVLAAGQGASAGPVISTQAPQVNPQTGVTDTLNKVSQRELLKEQKQVQEEQKMLTAAQFQNALKDNDVKDAEIRLKNAQRVKALTDAHKTSIDNKVAEVTGTGTNPSTPIKIGRDAAYIFGIGANSLYDKYMENIGKPFANQANKGINSITDYVKRKRRKGK